jgi:hypothetical protein
LNKIKGGDSKREVVCIQFGYPTKKNGLGYSSPREAAMAGLELMEGGHGGSSERKGGGRGEGGGWGRCLGRHGGRLGVPWGGCSSLFGPYCVVNMRKKKRRKVRRKIKGRKR